MNQIFDLKRFLMLFKKHTIDNYKTYLLSLAVLAGILLLLLGVVAYHNNGLLNLSLQFGFFASFLLIAGCIFTSMAFAGLGEKKKAISVLMLPASHFEKFLIGWLYSFVIFQLIYVSLFYLITNLAVQIVHPSFHTENFQVLNVFKNQSDFHPYYAFIFYILLHAVTFFGAVYFEKLHFIKTAFALFIGVFILGLINKPILSVMIDKKIIGVSIFSPVSITEGNQAWAIQPQEIKTYVEVIMFGIIVLILWAATYFRLKEKEV